MVLGCMDEGEKTKQQAHIYSSSLGIGELDLSELSVERAALIIWLHWLLLALIRQLHLWGGIA